MFRPHWNLCKPDRVSLFPANHKQWQSNVSVKCDSHSYLQGQRNWPNGDPITLQMWRSYRNKYFYHYNMIALRSVPRRELWQFMESTSCTEAGSSNLLWSKSFNHDGKYELSLQLECCSDCAALSLRDLAHPDWFSVNCSCPILTNLLCFLPQNTTITFGSAHHGVENATSEYCSETYILFNASCFLFRWKMWTQKDTLECFGDIWLFQYVFSAVRTSALPPILINSSTTIKIEKNFDTFSYTETIDDTNEPLCATKHRKIQTQKSENTFHCRDGTIISAQHVCDGTCNCYNGDDEKICTCDAGHNKIKTCSMNIDSSKGKICPLYTEATGSQCHVFTFSQISEPKAVPEIQKTQTKFLCKESDIVINSELVDDLVIDCYPNREDESKLVHLLMEVRFYSCTEHASSLQWRSFKMFSYFWNLYIQSWYSGQFKSL